MKKQVVLFLLTTLTMSSCTFLQSSNISFLGNSNTPIPNPTSATGTVYCDIICRVSLDSNQNQVASYSGVYAYNFASSSDARMVVFDSDASTLVANDTNGVSDIFVKDLQTGVVTRVSTDSSGVEANASSYDEKISGNGRYVMFSSYASNLVSGDTNGAGDVFVKDLQTGITTRVSTDSSGVEGNADSGYFYTQGISDDGRYIAFISSASNLVSGDTNGFPDAFIKDQQTGITTRVSTDSAGNEGLGGSTQSVVISKDGTAVAFVSGATNLVLGDINGQADVFYKSLVTNITERVSVSSSGVEANSNSMNPSITADKRYVAFTSSASNLVSGDTNAYMDLFVKDLQTGELIRASVDSSGAEVNAGIYYDSVISSDGQYVAFYSSATNFIPNDTNGVGDVFVKNLQTGLVTRVSVDSAGNESNGTSDAPSFSADGKYIIFESDATNLVSGDTNGVRDVFIRRLY